MSPASSVPRPPTGSRLWLEGARPKTLPAAVVPVVVGTAAAADGSGGSQGITWWRFAMALTVSVALQVGVNYANDYSDGVRGTDADRVGPLRLVGAGLVEPRRVKGAAFAAFGVAAVCGLVLASVTSWWILVVGAVSILAAWFYTGGPNPYGYLGLGELFVFVFFGLVATVGSAFVQVERVDGWHVVAAVPVGMLATALLVTNNLRDIPTDAAAGKRTLAVRLGEARTRWFYAGLMVGAFVAVAVVGVGWRTAGLLGLAGVVPAVAPVGAVLAEARGSTLIPVLVATGRTQLLMGAGLALGLWVGA